jgi:hypothetical protein
VHALLLVVPLTQLPVNLVRRAPSFFFWQYKLVCSDRKRDQTLAAGNCGNACVCSQQQHEDEGMGWCWCKAAGEEAVTGEYVS